MVISFSCPITIHDNVNQTDESNIFINFISIDIKSKWLQMNNKNIKRFESRCFFASLFGFATLPIIFVIQK